MFLPGPISKNGLDGIGPTELLAVDVAAAGRPAQPLLRQSFDPEVGVAACAVGPLLAADLEGGARLRRRVRLAADTRRHADLRLGEDDASLCLGAEIQAVLPGGALRDLAVHVLLAAEVVVQEVLTILLDARRDSLELDAPLRAGARARLLELPALPRADPLGDDERGSAGVVGLGRGRVRRDPEGDSRRGQEEQWRGEGDDQGTQEWRHLGAPEERRTMLAGGGKYHRSHRLLEHSAAGPGRPRQEPRQVVSAHPASR